MKLTPEPPKPRFSEVSLKLTFETQHELDAFASLFNNTSIASACRIIGIPCEAIRSNLAKIGGDIHLMPSKWNDEIGKFFKK